MSDKLPTPLIALGQNNHGQLTQYGIDPITAAQTYELGQQASTKYFQNALLPEMLEAVRRGDAGNKLFSISPDKYPFIEQLRQKDIGMMLVRPEMFHHTAAFLDFLRREGFQPFFCSTHEIDISMYWNLYKHAIVLPDAQPAIPTRTLVYTYAPTTLILFIDPIKRYKDKSTLADGFFKDYKGQQGIEREHTVRGEVVLQEAVKLGFNKLINRDVALAIDPMGVYRQLIRRAGTQPHSHLRRENQLLQYTGVSVHVPNSQELIHDLSKLCDVDELRQIVDALNLSRETQRESRYPHIDEYNRRWREGKIKKPLVILIGGYAGTGKSTLASGIARNIDFLNVLPTGIVHAGLRTIIAEENNPYLYRHTYDLDGLRKELPYRERIVRNYVDQCIPVVNAMQQIVDFAATERQHYLLDGNHILPGLIQGNDDVIFVEMYLKVDDLDTHTQMISGPTHNRTLTKPQIKTGRVMHAYIVEEARLHNRPIYESSDSYEQALALIDSILAQYL